jgi:hypothetical protein
MEKMMAVGFDDHSTVIALEFLVKKLVVQDCISASNPAETLAEWTAALKREGEIAMEYALGGHAENTEVAMNAVSGAVQFDRFAEEIEADFQEALGT